MECMHTCPRFLYLGVAVDSDILFYVCLLPTGSKLRLPFFLATEGLWKSRALGMLSMDVGSLHHEDMM